MNITNLKLSKMDKLITGIAIGISVVIIGIVGFAAKNDFFTDKNSGVKETVKDETRPVVTNPSSLNNIQLSLNTDSLDWISGSRYKVLVDVVDYTSFAENSIGYTLFLNYDPNILKVDKTYVGEVWTEQNVLQRDNDSATGKLIVTIGKGFTSASVTGKNNLLSIEFIVIGNGGVNTSISLGTDSIYAKSGQSGKLNTQPLVVRIK